MQDSLLTSRLSQMGIADLGLGALPISPLAYAQGKPALLEPQLVLSTLTILSLSFILAAACSCSQIK